MRFKFQLLTEDISSVRKMYPKISDADFEYIVKRFDPTYKAGSDSVGKYGKWLLNLANKKDFEVYGDEEQVHYFNDLINEFESKRDSLENKDIGQFKSIEELSNKLQNTPLPQLSSRQKERRMRKAYKDAELIWQNEDWMVWYPQNWDASCTLGKGTSWCTADSRTPKFYIKYVYGVDYDELMTLDEIGEKYITSENRLQDFMYDADLSWEEVGIEEGDDIYDATTLIIKYLKNKYSPNCIIEDSEGGIWFFNPHEKLTYDECESPLFIFINKKDPSYKYQLYCGNLHIDGFDNVRLWDIADRRDNLLDFTDLAWNDKSFADFAKEVLGVSVSSQPLIRTSFRSWYDEHDEE